MSQSREKYITMANSVKVLDLPAGERQKPFSLYAVLFTWYEEDIIEACVRNLFAEGVERVFLIDNGSPDATVELAVRAGALHVETVYSEYFAESVKCGAVFGFVRSFMEKEGAERIWWLFCDADELPTAPGTATIYEHIAQLDDNVRVVGGHFIAHYPVDVPHNCPGFHPVEFQFRATSHQDAAIYCPRTHDKHNLIRFDNGHFDMQIHGGYHRITRDAELYEDSQALRIHHINFRTRSHTLKRLTALVTVDAGGRSRLGDAQFNAMIQRGVPQHMGWYIDRRDFAEKMYAKDFVFNGPPREWRYVTRQLGCTDHMFSRWYDESVLFSAAAACFDGATYEAWRLSWYMMYKSAEAFLDLFARTPEAFLLQEHIYYAAQCYAAREQAENALRTLSALETARPSSEANRNFTPDGARLHVKRIIMGKAQPWIPL